MKRRKRMSITTGYTFHGTAFGLNGRIMKPNPAPMQNHGGCGGTNLDPNKEYTGSYAPFSVPGVLSHDGCTCSVKTIVDKGKTYFRTEVRAEIVNLQTQGDIPFSVGRIKLGMVSVYRPAWDPNYRRVRVLPMECAFENVMMGNMPSWPALPGPFNYSAKARESYLNDQAPDSGIDQEVRDTIASSASRSYYIPNFGRIFFCEWTVMPGDGWHWVHQISMVRLAMGSPIALDGSGGGGTTNGSPTGP
jgi:hypothetical protein